jgi:subtilase family serine protease
MRRTYVRGGIGVAVAALGLAALAVPASAATANSASPSVALNGSVPAWAKASAARGLVPASTQLRLTVVLNLRNAKGAAALAAAVSDPSSATYRHYLSAASFRSQFAPTGTDVAKVERWLRAAGLTVADVPANHRWVTVTGTAAQAERAFGTQLGSFTVNGKAQRAPRSVAKVPADVAGVVAGVDGLSSDARLNKPASVTPDKLGSAPAPPAFVNGRPCSTFWAQKTATTLPGAYGSKQPYAPCGYVPAQLQGAYGVNGLIAKGNNGAGVTVAIVDAYAAPTIASDANTYSAKHGLPTFTAGQFTQITPKAYNNGYWDKINGDTCGENGWYGEETLDVEAVHTMAPGADIVYSAGASCNDADLIRAENNVIDGHRAQIISNSWGGAGDIDPTTQGALLEAYTQTFVQAAIEGIGIFFSSGDNGDEIADIGTRSTDFPPSDPWVTAVGGTSLGIGSGNNYLFETGWGTSKSILTNGKWDPKVPGNYLYGAGGGTSQVFAQPWYQKGVVPSSISKYFGGPKGRAVPDIAALADPSTGFLIGESQTFPDGSVRYSEYRIGGTSLASPLMAGIEALADQSAGWAHGFANPAIYAMNGSSAYHDVMAPSSKMAVVRADNANGVDASGGLIFSLRSFNTSGTIFVRKGYDDVTGVGSPRGAVYVTHLGQ